MKNKIYQLGSYNRNLGDSIALLKIREYFPKYNFISLKCNKKIELEEINKSAALIIGGGGLIQGGLSNETETGWLFGFEDLYKVTVPVIVFGVGLNFFRGLPEMLTKGVKNLEKLIDRADFFSVRNDGSFEVLQKYVRNKKVKEIPDPGLTINKKNVEKEKLKKGCFNVAVNTHPKVHPYRLITNNDMEQISKKYNCPVVPHTVSKDLVLKQVNYVFKNVKAKNDYKQLYKYMNYDYVIAMRGHGQLVTIGMNIPGIYLSTQNKVTDFAIKHGYQNYLIDTRDLHWKEELDFRLKDLCNNPKPWYKTNKRNLDNFKKQFNEAINEVSHLLT